MKDNQVLLDLTLKLGYRLAMAGAETYRIEESVARILSCYHLESETFAIPNCLTISIKSEDGSSLTRMCRIGFHGNDLDSVERYSNLSRQICAAVPEPEVAMQWLEECDNKKKVYGFPAVLAGNFMAALGFSIFFGGNLIDSICAGFCGILVGIVHKLLSELKVNQFFSSIASAFLIALMAYALSFWNIADHSDAVIIGTLMLLMPGLIFTNAMRDIIFGDTYSGINRIVQMVMIASAVALGTGAAFQVAYHFCSPSLTGSVIQNPAIIQCVGATIGCVGFSILFNIHGPGGALCALGGFAAWATYCITVHLGYEPTLGYFIATLAASIYSEIMARVRKFPAISYLVLSIFPLIPGAGIYYASNFLAHGQYTEALEKGMETAGFTGAIAVGILIVSTVVRHFYVLKGLLNTNKKASD